jgi:predicted transcriptional regulator
VKAVDDGPTQALNKQLGLLVSCVNTIRVLTVLAERAASPKDIGQVLSMKTQTVGHHIEKLLTLGMIELIEERDVGGTMLHVYRAIIRPMVEADEWDALSVNERQKFSAWIVQLVVADAAKSLEAGAFDFHASRHLSRVPMVVDQEGLDEVAAIQDRALDEILEKQAVISDRIARESTASMNLMAAMMCFQLPERSVGPQSVWTQWADGH